MSRENRYILRNITIFLKKQQSYVPQSKLANFRNKINIIRNAFLLGFKQIVTDTNLTSKSINQNSGIKSEETKRNFSTYISIQLPNKAGEIIVLKILGQNISRKLQHVPDDEAVITLTPRHHWIRRQIVHHIIRLAQKRRWRISYLMNCFHFWPLKIGRRSSESTLGFYKDGSRNYARDTRKFWGGGERIYYWEKADEETESDSKNKCTIWQKKKTNPINKYMYQLCP